MTITPHFLTGAAITRKVKNPWLVFVLAFVSHFILDAIPHLDAGTFLYDIDYQPTWVYPVVIGEVVLLLFVFHKFFSKEKHYKIMFLGGFAAVLMDILDNLFLWKRGWPIFSELHAFHDWIHFNISPSQWYIGLLPTIIWIVLMLWYLLKTKEEK